MLSIKDKTTLAVGLTLPVTASLLALIVPDVVAPTTALAFAALAIGTAAIGVNAWMNAQAGGSMAQLIHETDTAVRPPEAASGMHESRWDVWERRGDALALTGTIRAFFALSVAVTVIILYAWIA